MIQLPNCTQEKATEAIAFSLLDATQADLGFRTAKAALTMRTDLESDL